MFQKFCSSSYQVTENCRLVGKALVGWIIDTCSVEGTNIANHCGYT